MSFAAVTVVFVFAVVSLYLWLVFPSRRKVDFPLEGKLIAHRGLHNGCDVPENSLSAFSSALAFGYPIELDVRLTKDGCPVVFHDGELFRLCGESGSVEALSLGRLLKMRLLNTDNKIPTLREALDLINGSVPVLIEIKASHKNCKAICEACDRILSDYDGVYLVQSFYPPVLVWYRKNRPSVLRGQLSASFKGEGALKRAAGFLLFGFIARPDFISYAAVDEGCFSLRLQRLMGTPLLGWTFRSKSELSKLHNCFDGYIFENFLP